jgi:hypothetical protein
MNLENLKEGDVVAAVCAGCAQTHAWDVVRPVSSLHVTMQRGWHPGLCTCARQTTSVGNVVCVLAEFAGLKL